MPVRRSRVDVARRDRDPARGVITLDLRVSSGTYVRSIADALGGHCVSLRRTEVGPFRVEEADERTVLGVEEALARIGLTPGGGGARAARWPRREPAASEAQQ